MPRLVVMTVALPCGDMPHDAEPALFGMRSGDDDMKSATVTIVTFHLREGGQRCIVRRGAS